MKRNIQPITTKDLAANTEMTATQFEIKSFSGYRFPAPRGGSVSCNYLDAQDNVIATTNVALPAAVVDAWGADDSVIMDYAAAQLNITLL